MPHKNIFTLLLVCSLLTAPSVKAGPVDVETAREKAVSFLYSHNVRSHNSSELTLRCATSNTFLFEDHQQFALVAADDRLPEILGYGMKGNGTIPPALEGFLNAPKTATAKYAADRTAPVGPLLTFVRHQKAPYNNYCPYYKFDNGEIFNRRCVVGCVATALEEIISYYRREVVLLDTLKGWETPHYTIEDILPGTSVDCKLIRDNYDIEDYTDEEVDAVARLSYYCGVAAHMNWGLGESGANISRLVQPLQKAFGYQYVNNVDSYKYAPSDWIKMMQQEIYAHRPILYAAFNMWMGGHAFVLDGLDDKGFFHVNWAYGGSYDGYFRLDVLNYNEPPEQMTPEGMEAGFYSNHQALLLHPDKVENVLPDTLSRTGKEIVIDSVKIELAPETGKHTPMSVYLRNTTNQTLTTPFEFFTNLPQDTALLEQGDFVALGAAILKPYEQRVMKIHAAFNQPGERTLRISPDDVTMLYEGSVTVTKGKSPQLTFHEPEISFPAADEAFIRLTVTNAEEAGRCGQEVLYEVGPGDANTMKDGVRHSRHLYVMPGETKSDTVRFHYLEPGQTYTLLVRSPWFVQTQRTFVMPDNSGIDTPLISETESTEIWYAIDGRRLTSAPTHKGVYLRKKGQKTEKVYFSK